MKKNKLQVLVTGATGFLGTATLKALQRRDDVAVIAACRTPAKLLPDFQGAVRAGDLRDAAYRELVVRDIDVVCHAGTWAAMWGHARLEREWFYEPAVDLIERSIASGVRRFILAGTVAVTPGAPEGQRTDDFAPATYTGFWPHVDRLIDLERYMYRRRASGMQMVSLRLGHFVGAGNHLGLLSALVPRLRTRLVPYLAGECRMPMIADSDLGQAFALAATAPAGRLSSYESFNIGGPSYPTVREVFEFAARESASPLPAFRVSYAAAYVFAWLTEVLSPLLPGSSPFLTRSIVYLAEHRDCPTDYAREKLGFRPSRDWRDAAREALAELRERGFPWPRLGQAVR
jgi:nucleoside-diphosphate-sugar epimerase